MADGKFPATAGPLTTLTTVPDDHALAAVTGDPAVSSTAALRGSLRTSLSTSVVLDAVLDAISQIAAGQSGHRELEVLDIGGGTGGLAVQLAQRGHQVTVVDPSPDSLAALKRRAAETGTAGRVVGRQGDAAGIRELIEPGSVDLVLCHSVLEVVDDPAQSLRALVATLRPDGRLSLLVGNRVAAVAARVSAGRLAEAAAMLADNGETSTMGSGGSERLARRFTVEELRALAAAAGLRIDDLHGVRMFADLAPAALLDDPTAAGQLLALERAAARDPAYLPVAAQLHALGSTAQQAPGNTAQQ